MKHIPMRDLETYFRTFYQTEPDANRIVESTQIEPQQSQWKRFVETSLLSMGVVQLLAGIIFFFAFNWGAFHRFGKLGLVAGLLAGSAITSIIAKKNDLIRTLSYLSFQILTGVLLTLWGQIYQTGADAFNLFFGWALLTIPVTIIAQSLSLWTVWMVLINTTLLLFSSQRLGGVDDEATIMAIVVNGIAIILYEILYKQEILKESTRWFPTVVTTILCGILTTTMWKTIFWGTSGLAVLATMVTIAVLTTVYTKVVRSLGQVTLASFLLLILIFSFITEAIDFNWNEGTILFYGITLLGSVAGIVTLLTKTKNRWDAEEVNYEQ